MSSAVPAARRLWPYLLLAFAPLTWGGNLVVGRALAGAVDPTTLNAVRWGGAAVILAAFSGRDLWRHRGALWRERRLIAALGLSGIGGFHLLQYTALAHTTVVNVALITATTPLYVALIAGTLSGDRLAVRQWAGVALSVVGAVVVVARGDLATLVRLDLRGGDLIQLVAVTFWALYTVLLRWRPADVPPLTFLLATILPGLALTAASYAVRDVELVLTGEIALGLSYLVIFPSTLAYLAWGGGVKALGPQVGAAFSNLVPVYGALLAVALLGEPLRPYHLTAAVLVGGGIWLVSRPGASRERRGWA
jgi:drug/metabolite transporter (DMT)-like permease